jgi:alpha-galactosidase
MSQFLVINYLSSSILKGIKRLGLLITGNGVGYNRTYASWADAKFEMIGKNMPQNIPNDGEKYTLTPEATQTPKINSASVFGARPNNSFQFTLLATGQRPMIFAAENLPYGLSIDTNTGIITGKVTEKGDFTTTLIAKNTLGNDKKVVRIKIGDEIALTPPIGWNSWAREIDREKVIASANAMVKSGLNNHGWSYINIDDAWQGLRGGSLNALQPNEKFPKFKEMIDEVHAKGLKIGVYSTPWITSYAGYAGGLLILKMGHFPIL